MVADVVDGEEVNVDVVGDTAQQALVLLVDGLGPGHAFALEERYEAAEGAAGPRCRREEVSVDGGC